MQIAALVNDRAHFIITIIDHENRIALRLKFLRFSGHNDTAGNPQVAVDLTLPVSYYELLCRFSGNWTIADFSKRLPSVVAAGSIVRFLRHQGAFNPMWA